MTTLPAPKPKKRKDLPAYYRGLLDEQEASGQSLLAFAKTKGTQAQSLYGWRRRLRQGDEGQKASPATMANNTSGFVEVSLIGSGQEPAGQAGHYVLHLDQIRVEVPRGFDPNDLARLVHCLSAC